MWTYAQKTGQLYDSKGELRGVGYAGNGQGKNNPDMETVKNTGPLPAGLYYVGDPTSEHAHLGPFALPLVPYATTPTFGRTGFFIHGDSILNPGFASNGCIVLSLNLRRMIKYSADYLLNVVHNV